MRLKRFPTNTGDNATETPEKLDDGKKKKLPFIRSSKPAKQCPSPRHNNGGEGNQSDPFHHLLNADVSTASTSSESNQSTDRHNAAYRQLGLLSGHRVSRQPVGTPNDAIVNHCSTSRRGSRVAAVLPPWEKLISSKRRGVKRNVQKKATGGQWKTVDEHVEQLRRKAACLNRSLPEDASSKDASITQKLPGTEKHIQIKSEVPEPQHLSQSSFFSAASGAMKRTGAQSVSTAVSWVNGSCTKSLGIPKPSMFLLDSETEQGPAWKPAFVIGKCPEPTSNAQMPPRSCHQETLDQETFQSILDACKAPTLGITIPSHSNHQNVPLHTTQRNTDKSQGLPASHSSESNQRLQVSHSDRCLGVSVSQSDFSLRLSAPCSDIGQGLSAWRSNRSQGLPASHSDITQGLSASHSNFSQGLSASRSDISQGLSATCSDSSYQQVPGSEKIDVNSLNSPWPNLWSPIPVQNTESTDESPTDKVREE